MPSRFNARMFGLPSHPLPNFLHFVEFQQNRKNHEFHKLLTQNYDIFSRDLRLVIIDQIELNQNMEMRRNNSTLCFRE